MHDPWEDGDEHIDLAAIRAHLRKLSDIELIREGHAARELISSEGRGGRATTENLRRRPGGVPRRVAPPASKAVAEEVDRRYILSWVRPGR